MTDDRADRVQTIATLLHGKVLDRDGDTMHLEIPADLLGAALSLCGQAGFNARVCGQQTSRMAPRRVTTMAGCQVVDPDNSDMMVFYPIRIELSHRHVAISDDPHRDVAAITRQVKR